MSARIPEEVIRSVLETVNIRHIVEEYVPLKKRGRNWVGLCPFHSDSDPSFSVNEEKQIFYCFGCGQGGNVFNFLMRMQGISFIETVKTLAARYGISVPERPRTQGETQRLKHREEIIRLNEIAAAFYAEQLSRAAGASSARDYLERRGLSQEVIMRFGLGWAPEWWDGLVNHIQALGKMGETAEAAGLLIAREGGRGHYDRFRGRVIFPIHDRQGNVAALGGRTLGDAQPKYLNSPETLVYHKGSILYGLHHNKGAIRRAGRGYVVEGYMDLLALVQAGISNAVATLGTALTDDHVKQLAGLCKDWFLVFDGDSAGVKAALRALPLCYKAGLRVKVLALPAGDDPDTFVRREGADAWQGASEQALTGLDFVVENGLKAYGRDPDGRHRILEDVVAVLEPIPDAVRKSLLAGHAAQRLGVREETLWECLEAGRKNSMKAVRSTSNSSSCTPKGRAGAKSAESGAEARFVGFLLGHPTYMGAFLDDGLEMWLEDGQLRSLWTAMLHVYSISGRLDLSQLFEQLEPLPGVRTLAMQLTAASPPCDAPEEMFRSLRKYCENRRKKALRVHILEQMKHASEETDNEHLLMQILKLR